MKYMGSKRYMLNNGLSALLLREAKKANRFVDLFCGSGAVARHIAYNVPIPVISVDLQEYARVLTHAVTGRSSRVDSSRLQQQWIDVARSTFRKSRLLKKIGMLEHEDIPTSQLVIRARTLCEQPSTIGPIWNAYGGHYFSPRQALTIDYLLKYMPKREPARMVSLATLIRTASVCSASPGHTAQPFQTRKNGSKYIKESWVKDPFSLCAQYLKELSEEHALVAGQSYTGDAMKYVNLLKKGDLVFIDPPYSAVHYSRFYHVLETIARGHCSEVSGVGRYPPYDERPSSAFSMSAQAKDALESLLKKISEKEATVVFTFPRENCSNGLSGEVVELVASKFFDVTCPVRKNRRSSTLGGNNRDRNGKLEELAFLMKPLNRSAFAVSRSSLRVKEVA